jgi:prepilin-type N-terminal cleavage/methylation domain-containing protein
MSGREHTTRRRHRGFTLWELLITLPLLAVFATMAVPMLRWSVRSMRAADTASANAARLDRGIAVLRQDVWGAAAIARPSPHEMRLTSADRGTVVTWHIGPGPELRRSGDVESQWSDPFPDASVAVDGSAVQLTIAGGAGYRGGTLALPNASRLVTGGER